MAERIRSKDGKRETEEILGEAPENLESPSAQGSSGGTLQRKIGTRDEKKQIDETSAGATRPLGGDERDSGEKEKM
ncbi:hypothetical protein [Thioclava atlantica]|uniref:Uncharacterized protein n=1 Tax=Thioclava atlantica TaxID=1317124 RepID=A0A085U1W3_9RHOB|nr:hypothetical protein [Thioclava atlantica]KFE36960.1 hypothetical protein DW2_02340 [Thioclava atlantica]